MSEINPISRLYSDIVTILNSLTIKYKYRADENETMESKSRADRYINALLGKDTFFQYDDYTADEYQRAGITDTKAISLYQRNRFSVPAEYQSKLLQYRRERELESYTEVNNYYRMLNGQPDVGDTDFIYVPEDIAKTYKIPTDVPVHLIEDTLGSYYTSILTSIGFFDSLIEKYPDKEYLQHLGGKRISIQYARQAKNFAILSVEQDTVMESTYREFVRSYEKARIYFVSTAYVYEFRSSIPYYDNFIALCIFVMAIQQVSMRSIQNAVEREFYDEYMIQLLYQTYGIPYFTRIDEATQKQICQNVNLLIQNKATNKVIIDIASILGFNDVNVYQYYLIKEQNFDDSGRPIIKKKKQINSSTGEEEEVYDWEAMKNIYFQKVNIEETNIKEAFVDPVNRVEYSEVTYYDPFWWSDDDDLYKEIWETEYNYMETKYLGITIPYRMTELVFQSVILLKMIMEKKDELGNLTVDLPKITDKEVTLTDTVILFFALMSKKLGISGQIMTLPSKLTHILETTDQDINKENEHIEVLSFNFDAFSPERIDETRAILEPYFTRREYRVVNGHDVDLREDGTQDTFAPTHLVSFENNTDDLEEFYGYITQLTIPDGTAAEKREALNNIYYNIEALYLFLTYHMSKTTDIEEYYALKTFYDTAFYSQETAKMFTVETEDGTRPAETFEEYFLYTDSELYLYIQNIEVDDIYAIIDHIIYKMEDVVDQVGALYSLNDGFSPLIELFKILVVFFKSYILDFESMSSLMVLDFEMDNTIRLFADPKHISKVDEADDHFDEDFMDILHQYIVHYRKEDKIAIEEYIRSHAKLHVNEEEYIHDAKEYLRLIKVDAIKSYFEAFDTIESVHGKIQMSDQLTFEDFCIKKN